MRRPKRNSCTTSALWRCNVGMKERTAPLRSGWWEASLAALPPSLEPTLTSTTVRSGSTSPFRNNGYTPRMVAVALHPAPVTRLAPRISSRCSSGTP